MNVFRSEARHTWLLAALVLMEVANPLIAREGSLGQTVSVVLLMTAGAAIFGCAMDTTRQRVIGALVLLPAVAIELGRTVTPANWHVALDVTSDLSLAAFLAFVVGIIVRHVFGAQRIGIDDVVGAFAGYLMTALLWGRLYALVWTIAPDAFEVSDRIAWQLESWHLRHALFDYYSIATLATVGYADVTTTAPASNTLLWLEVMCGQFYLAVVVATIVGLKLAQALTEARR